MNRGIAFFFLLFFVSAEYAQIQDSSAIYEKIKKAASKRTFTTWIYNAIFVDPAPQEYPTEPESKVKHVNPYLKHRNHIIRNINITVYNPFGHKVEDTTLHYSNFLEKVANHIHVNTRKWIIINRLLFKNNDTLNALTLSESERLLRQASFINDARIYVTGKKNTDSIDVNVDVYDKWAITAPFIITPQGGNIRFRNQNFLGIGQQFEQRVGYKTPNTFDFSGFYNIANLDKTYISSQLAYRTSIDGTSLALSFDRPYFSPLAKWAGGASINHNWGFFRYVDTIQDIDKKLTLNSMGYDLWLGKSFKLGKAKTLFDQSTNIIVGERFYQNTFLARPKFDIDTARSNFNSSAFVGNIGLSVQQYYKDKFIYRFGSNEDVPEGLIVQMIYGASKQEFKDIRYYAGMEIARAKKFRFGYMTSTFSYGLFCNKFITNDITTKFNIYYLANLAKKGRWYFREFLNYSIVHGENKVLGEAITIKSDEMYGFNSGSMSGKTKMILTFETVAYAPYNLVGFRFASIAMAGIGIVGSPQNKIENSPLYQAYSMGLMVRNEHLVSSTFQISVGLYPFLPDGRNTVFSFNPITSFTLRVRSFSMGRPEFISY